MFRTAYYNVFEMVKVFQEKKIDSKMTKTAIGPKYNQLLRHFLFQLKDKTPCEEKVLPVLQHRLTRPASPRYQRFQRVLPVPPGGGVLTHSVYQSEKTKVKNSKNNIDYSLFYSNISFIF